MGKKRKRNSGTNASQLATKPNKYQKKQQKYIEKKKNEKVERVPSKLSKFELEKWKSMLEPLQSEANKRIEMIQASGYSSFALDRVIKEGGKDYFDLDADVSTREELIREMTRLNVFINDKGSTVEIAKLETAQIYASQYRGKFGNEYNNKENNFAKYDIKALDPAVAVKAFETYHKIAGSRVSQIVGDGGYGSENLILAIYDAEIRGKDSLIYGMDLLDTFIQTTDKSWENATKESNLITGITGVIEDNITGGYLF